MFNFFVITYFYKAARNNLMQLIFLIFILQKLFINILIISFQNYELFAIK